MCNLEHIYIRPQHYSRRRLIPFSDINNLSSISNINNNIMFENCGYFWDFLSILTSTSYFATNAPGEINLEGELEYLMKSLVFLFETKKPWVQAHFFKIKPHKNIHPCEENVNPCKVKHSPVRCEKKYPPLSNKNHDDDERDSGALVGFMRWRAACWSYSNAAHTTFAQPTHQLQMHHNPLYQKKNTILDCTLIKYIDMLPLLLLQILLNIWPLKCNTLNTSQCNVLK